MRRRSVGFDAVAGLHRGVILALLAVAFLFSLAQHAAQAETRSLKLYNTHTKERVTIAFKRNGRYIPSGLREVNRFLRDWRRNEITKIDPELLDLVWEVYQEVGGRKHIHVVSSYRSPATNNMLRKRSKGVARNSQHTMGRAMDFYIPGVNLAKLRKAGMRRQVGGVGYYPRSGSPFVHMDTGRVRHWPRMPRNQLANLFPDGKTLHLPSNGKPLKGYKQAQAAEKAGKLGKVNRGRRSLPTLIARSDGGNRTTGQSVSNSGDVIRPTAASSSGSSSGGGGNLLASLFRADGDSGSGGPTPPGAVGTRANSSPARPAAPVTTVPPIPPATPGDAAQDPVVVAGIAPAPKPERAVPAPVQIASATPPPANTLDAQRVALEQGASNPAGTLSSPNGRFDAAGLGRAQAAHEALLAAARRSVEAGASGPVPAPAPQNDPVAAIAAATGTGELITATPQRPPTTLAYASATAIPPTLRTTPDQRRANAQSDEPRRPAASVPERSVSGRIPRDQITDPLAGFAALPDKAEPKLLSGEGTTRHALFAALSHPDQRALDAFIKPGNRFVNAGFDRFPYGALRTDRFDGPAIVVLPVTFAR